MRTRIDVYLCPHLHFVSFALSFCVPKKPQKRKKVNNKEWKIFGESKKIVTFEDLKCVLNALVDSK